MVEILLKYRIRNRAAQILAERCEAAGGCFTSANFCDDTRCKCMIEAWEQAERKINSNSKEQSDA